MMVPLRCLAEALGYEVHWGGAPTLGLPADMQQAQTVLLTMTFAKGNVRQEATIVLADGVPRAYSTHASGEWRLDAAPALIGNTMYLPVRFLPDRLGNTVQWEENSQSVTFTKVKAEAILEAPSYVQTDGTTARIGVNVINHTQEALPVFAMQHLLFQAAVYDENAQQVYPEPVNRGSAGLPIIWEQHNYAPGTQEMRHITCTDLAPGTYAAKIRVVAHAVAFGFRVIPLEENRYITFEIEG